MIKFIDYLNKDCDYKPQCRRCGYADHVWSIDGEWICKNCMSIHEAISVIIEIENVLLSE
jgi:hypothetical protein